MGILGLGGFVVSPLGRCSRLQSMTPTPHDELFKAVFKRTREARALLRVALPASVLEHLDLSTLAPAEDRLPTPSGHREADLVFTARIRGRDALVIFLVEHKSWFPADVAIQLLVYVALLLQQWMRDHGGPLPAVVPVVLYHGERPAPSSVGIDDLNDSSLPAGMLAWMPSFRVPILDLNRVSLDDLLERLGPTSERAAAALAVMKSIRDEGLVDVVRRAAPVLRKSRVRRGGIEFEVDLLRYVLRAARHPPALEELDEVMAKHVDPRAGGVVMTLAEQLEKKGLEKGLEEGRVEGAAGEARESLRRVLTLRFGQAPEASAARIDAADLDMLRGWIDAAVLADRLEDVFRSPDS